MTKGRGTGAKAPWSGSPAVLARILEAAVSDAGGIEAATRALTEEAVALGDVREGAWPLLGADALLTQLAAEAFEAEGSPESRLAALVRLPQGGL